MKYHGFQLSVDATEKSLAPSSSFPPIRYWYTFSHLQAEQFQLSWSLLVWEVLQSHTHLCGDVLDSLQEVHVSFVAITLQMWPCQCCVEGQDHLPWPSSDALANAAQDFCHKAVDVNSYLARKWRNVRTEHSELLLKKNTWVAVAGASVSYNFEYSV